MKTFLITTLLAARLFAAEQFIVIPWSQANTNSQERIDGIPPTWPMLLVPARTNVTVPDGAELMTAKQVERRKSDLAAVYAAFEARRAAREAAMDEVVKNAKTVLFDLFDDFAAYEDGWKAGTNYTAAQIQQIVRKHNRALIKMRPIIRDLYREE